MVPSGPQFEELHVQQMGDQGQRDPVAGNPGGQRPAQTRSRQTAADDRVLRDELCVVEVDEPETGGLTEHRQRERDDECLRPETSPSSLRRTFLPSGISHGRHCTKAVGAVTVRSGSGREVGLVRPAAIAERLRRVPRPYSFDSLPTNTFCNSGSPSTNSRRASAMKRCPSRFGWASAGGFRRTQKGRVSCQPCSCISCW